EVIIILQSPGGEVTSFAFAAAQVARLRSAGWKVTISVDRIAASGGYMIASQATQILASPFAMVGSIGVITETLNFYETLKKYGVKSLVLKAGDMKNPITQYGEVSKEDIQNTQEDLEEIHESFINLCRLRRPALDLEVCNGRVLSGDRALEKGMIDRILTSDEYIMEKMSEG
ncbi:peptidase S49, partial [Fragilariopsis cylindrus CCMP1102]